jgi:hypothetical protein
LDPRALRTRRRRRGCALAFSTGARRQTVGAIMKSIPLDLVFS